MIIAISGKKQSGKDTLGKIMQILLNSPQLNNEGVQTFLRKEVNSDKSYHPGWEIKKFADKLKDIVCLLIGCTREQLEDEEFKSKELGEEWNKWSITSQFDTTYYISYDEALASHGGYYEPVLIKMTPRLLLQLLGTECGREIIHPQIWVNALMSEYKAHNHNEEMKGMSPSYSLFPDWIITDMRFPNEQKAVDIRHGICIRVNKEFELDLETVPGRIHISKEHKSETALDNALFDYTIDNDGTIDELIDKVRVILTRENLL